MVKSFLPVAAWALVAVAGAQDRATLEAQVAQALANTGATGEVHLRLDTDKTVRVNVAGAWQDVPLRSTELHFARLDAANDPNPIIVAEIVSYEKNVMVRRVVADGATVHAYDLQNRTRLALPYAKPEDILPGGVRSARYPLAAMAYLGAVTRREETEAMRLLRYILNPPVDQTRLNWLTQGWFDPASSGGDTLTYKAGPVATPRRALTWRTDFDEERGFLFRSLALWRADGNGYQASLTTATGASYQPATADVVQGFRRLPPPRIYVPDAG